MKNPMGKEPPEIVKIVKFSRNNELLEGKVLDTKIEFQSRPQKTVYTVLEDEELGSIVQFKIPRICHATSRATSPKKDLQSPHIADVFAFT